MQGHLKFKYLTGIILIIIFGQAFGQDPNMCACNFDNWTGGCEATVEISQGWVQVTSDVDNCSRVDWRSNEASHMTIVEHLKVVEEFDQLGSDAPFSVSIDRCLVCRTQGEAAEYARQQREGESRSSNTGNGGKSATTDISGAWECGGSANYTNGHTSTFNGQIYFMSWEGVNYEWTNYFSYEFMAPEGKTYRDTGSGSQIVSSWAEGRATLNGTELSTWVTEGKVEKGAAATTVKTDFLVNKNRIEMVSFSGFPHIQRISRVCVR